MGNYEGKRGKSMSDVKMLINGKEVDVMKSPFKKLYQISLLKNQTRFKILTALYLSEFLEKKSKKIKKR